MSVFRTLEVGVPTARSRRFKVRLPWVKRPPAIRRNASVTWNVAWPNAATDSSVMTLRAPGWAVIGMVRPGNGVRLMSKNDGSWLDRWCE